MNTDNNFNKYSRLNLELEYLNYLNQNNICKIPDSLISNINKNYNPNINLSITEYIKSKLPISLSPYVSFGVTNNIMEIINCIVYINSKISYTNENLKNCCFKIKKYLDKFNTNNCFKNNIIENTFELEINPLTTINYIDYKLNSSNNFFKYAVKNIPFDFYDFLKKYDINFREKIGEKDIHSFLLVLSFLLTKLNIIIKNLYNFNDILNKNTYLLGLNKIKIFFITMKQNIIDIINNLDYDSFIFCPIYLDNLNKYLLKLNQIIENQQDSELVDCLKKIFYVNNIAINKDLLTNKNLEEIKEIIYGLNIDIKIIDYISKNIFNDSPRTIQKINQTNLINDTKKKSRLGIWNNFWSSRINRKFKECCVLNFCKEIIIKNNIKNIEEWGCGQARIKKLINDIKYLGIDGSDTGFQDKIYDLVEYKSNVECILMKHVLEHNVEWKKILINMFQSFQKLAILVIHTPFQSNTNVIGYSLDEINKYGFNVKLEKIGFSKSDLIDIFNKYNINYELVKIDNPNLKNENIILLQK